MSCLKYNKIVDYVECSIKTVAYNGPIVIIYYNENLKSGNVSSNQPRIWDEIA